MSRFLRSKMHDDTHIVIDLEHVVAYSAYKESNDDGTYLEHVAVHVATTKVVLEISFEVFDKAFMAYQASKVFPGYPGVPVIPVEPLTPSEPYEPKDIYAPTTTTGDLIWKGTSDTTTTVRLSKAPKAKKGKKK